MPDFDGRVRAPELDGAVDWLNVPAPLSLTQLRGKIVLLDFWTYGCINCMHILPELKRLEAKYERELVVIGIHSAKFTNERDSDNIRRILVRYEIEHPVANDALFKIWRAYGVRAWPTQVLIDPAGYVVGGASGEGNAEAFDRAIAAVIHVFDERGELNRQPLPVALERSRFADADLKYPGKVLADEQGGRLFIADSNHNRVLVTTLERVVRPFRVVDEANEAETSYYLQIIDQIGSGRFGDRDGAFARAELYRPQGLALQGNMLYIADTENHLIRAADLDAREVRRVAGTGAPAAWGGEGGAALETAISSPWDLAIHSGLLFIAMAGTHQVWMLDLARRLVLPYAGSGREARIDGGLDGSAFAQPSGLAHGVEKDSRPLLFVADSESNIIRAIALPPVNDVRTLAGGDLFEFGDKDGRGDDVRLQHPLGVAWHDGRVFIADTYNHKIKVLDPATREVRTFAGTGERGREDGPASRATFYEPGGVSIAGGKIYVADTNNHALRTIDLQHGRVETLSIGRSAIG
jgi:thiol-disulfide isomerase/thioredoxin